MAYTTIDDPSAHFQTALWTGTGSAGNAVTFDGNSDMQPDFVWSKRRDVGYSHVLKDTSRGGTANNDLHLVSNLTNAESTYTNYRMDFNSDGFTLDGVGDSGFQGSGTSMVSWAWKANGGTTSSNTDGTITTTTQSNATAGFSIATWTGNGTNGATIGHGNGGIPNGYIVKRLDTTASWGVGGGYTGNIWVGGTSDVLNLNGDGAVTEVNNYWGSSPPNSNILPLSADGEVNASGGSYVGYFFRSIQGYSKLGRYTGNGNANGPFVYTGFKPAFLMVKRTDSSGSWQIKDSARNPSNLADKTLFPNLSNAEYSTFYFYDLLSNGFKVRGTDAELNASGGTYLYMAFAENPFVTSTGIPTTAR